MHLIAARTVKLSKHINNKLHVAQVHVVTGVFFIQKLRNLVQATQKVTCQAEQSNFPHEHFVSRSYMWHTNFTWDAFKTQK